MKNLLLSLFLIGICITQCISQEFIHDTIAVSSEGELHLYYFGLTTAKQITSEFPNSRIRNKIKKEGKRDNKTFTQTTKITLPDGHTHFYCAASGKDKIFDDSTLTFSSIKIEQGSEIQIDQSLWLDQPKQSLSLQLGESVAEKKRNTYYYPEQGVTIRYLSKRNMAIPKEITFYESPQVADQNFQIYLDWKSKQEE